MQFDKSESVVIYHSFVTAVSQLLSPPYAILLVMSKRKDAPKTQIGLDTAVYCQNEFCGLTAYLIIRPTSWILTHIVVKPAKLPAISNRIDRLVPISHINKIADDNIWLACSIDNFAKLPPFTETLFTEISASDYSFMEYGFWAPLNSNQNWMYVPLIKYNTPSGETIISHQLQVEAKNGHLGQFKTLIVDPESFNITHVVFQWGHLWERKQEMVSTSIIDRVEGDTIFLEINKSDFSKQ